MKQCQIWRVEEGTAIFMQTVSYACGLLCSDIFSKRKKGESSDFDREFKGFKVSTGFDSPDHYRGNL